MQDQWYAHCETVLHSANKKTNKKQNIYIKINETARELKKRAFSEKTKPFVTFASLTIERNIFMKPTKAEKKIGEMVVCIMKSN